jgi:deoxyribonuclease IV
MILGAHISVAGGLDLAPARGVAIGCEAIQIFSRNQRQWQAKPLTAAEADKFCAAFDASGLKSACIHASYLINLAAPDAQTWQKSIKTLTEELRRAEMLGIPFVIVHPGAHKDRGIEAGWKRAVIALRRVLDSAKAEHVTLLLENTAGQGTYLASTFEQLAFALQLLAAGPAVGVCLDTCHLLAAGNEFRTKAEYQHLKKKIAATVGLKKIRALHLNDSKKPFGSHVDNHAAIGRGHIGLKPFGFWINDKTWAKTPAVLETPGGEKNYQRELKLLRKLATILS